MPSSTDRRDPRTGRARNLRRSATPAERKLWRQLNQLQIPEGHFRRQAPIGPYFAHHGLKLIVEVDGAQHGLEQGLRRDEARTSFLLASGYRVLRFWNNEVTENLDGVVETILAACAEAPPTLTLPTASGGRG